MAHEKSDCWEYMACGREPGGSKTAEYGVCPAATHEGYDGRNGGTCAGRSCWAVSGTLCRGQVQGHFARKLGDCFLCDFFKLVEREEERAFVLFTR